MKQKRIICLISNEKVKKKRKKKEKEKDLELTKQSSRSV